MEKNKIIELRFFNNPTKKGTVIARTEQGKICFLHNKHLYVNPGEIWKCKILISQEKQNIVEPLELVYKPIVKPVPKSKQSFFKKLLNILKF